ncbi:MAG: hypothetical protein K2X81_09185, partial [Candidatus Obscuribacterales bacterium]|nr:hypothetical protein [Candidatus Obscuribacterales bacterium]
QGGAVGEVGESADPNVPVGTLVLHMAGWRDEATVGRTAGRRQKWLLTALALYSSHNSFYQAAGSC